MPVIFLVDNGSKRPEATLQLRRIASDLSQHSGHNIHPVSLQHADSIDPGLLNGVPANVFPKTLHHHLTQGDREFVILPLFFGPSRALTSFIPQQAEILRSEFEDFSIKVADVIYPLPEGDSRLTTILVEHIKNISHGAQKIVLVDHGTPSREINQVRRSLADDIHLKTNNDIKVEQAVMERRDGKEYDFNGELLENWLRDQAGQGIESVIIAMLFFLPGKHAGQCGDIESICMNVSQEYPRLKFKITPLVSEHPLLLEILEDRLNHAINNH